MGSLIPVEYQQVEYLEGTGSQYIISNLHIYSDTVCNCKFMKTTSNQTVYGVVFGAIVTTSSNPAFTMFLNGISTITGRFGKWTSSNLSKNIETTVPLNNNEIIECTCSINQVSVNKETFIGNLSWDDSLSNSKMGLFCRVNGNTSYGPTAIGKCRIYSLSFTSQTESANFIPCYRKSDNEPGMYDTVSNTFFTNSGNGTFLIGGEVHEYGNLIESRKNIILNTPHLTTTTAAPIATFNTDMKAPLDSLKVYFNPIQEGSGDPSPDNVRAINGWTGMNIYKTGKNLCSGKRFADELAACFTSATIDTNAKTVSWPYNTGINNDNSFPIVPFKANTRYTFILTIQNNTIARSNLLVYYTDGTTENFPDISETGVKKTVIYTSKANKTIQRLWRKQSGGTSILYYDESGVFEGTITTDDFAAYNGTTLPINWTTEAGTVYGGYVDLVSGEVWKTHHKITLDGVTTNCKVNSDYSGGTYIVGGVVYLSPGGAQDYYSGYRSKLYSNNTPLIGAGDQSLETLPFIQTIGNGAQYLRIYLAYTADHPELDTGQKRKDFCNAYLTENPIDIVYPLTTPTLLTTLTPTQLKTLRGTNNIWSNANGNIELAYWSH